MHIFFYAARTMLCFDAGAWDLFLPYEQYFLRELESIWVHGFSATVVVTPYGKGVSLGTVTGVDRWSLFAWGPDGSYKDFVVVSVLVFIAIHSALGDLRLPEFLIHDLVSLSAVHEQKGGIVDRCCSVLRVSSKDHLTTRMPDPLMIDWMLLRSGLGSEGKATDFVKRYNASVFYDRNLELKDQAATRQCNLLNPEKISNERKALLRRRVNASESFAQSGLTIQIMNLAEFWAGAKMHSSSHMLWEALGTTTEDSCTAALNAYFDRCDKGQTGTAVFKEVSKRAVLCDSLSKGTYARMKFKDSVVSGMVAKIHNGKYDGDIAAMLTDCEELDEFNLRCFDAHLCEYYTVCVDAIELNNLSVAAATATDAGPDGSATAPLAGMSDSAWALHELEHSLACYEKCTAAFNTKKDELKKKEAEFLAAARSNSASATQSFLDKYLKMMSYHSYADKINRELNAIIESRLEEVCKHEGCERGSVLVTCFTDRSSVSV